MKRYAFLALCLVLTAALLVGCGCTNQKMDDKNTSAPTVLPTNEEVWNTTENTSRPTTPSTAATEPTATFDRGNGALEDTPNGTEGMNGTNGTTGNNDTAGTNGTAGNGATGTTPTEGTAGQASRMIPNTK